MAIFEPPRASPEIANGLEQLGDLRRSLDLGTSHAGPWMGMLRRQVKARSVEGSTSIEGYSVGEEEAVALVGGARPGAGDEDQLAVACYARAMDHVAAMARDPAFRWLDRVILDLHFDACHFQPDKRPGLWRTGPIAVTGADGTIEYRGPDGDRVVALMDEVIGWLRDDDSDVVVRAALAHLNVVSVHPFQDGNGRVARIVQSLVLAREGGGSPEFSSIEEYLGKHTPAYYAALRSTQGGGYQPSRDAAGWVRFCIEAHIVQARQRLAQIEAAAARWNRLEQEVARRGWPDRFAIALERALIGGADSAGYRAEADVSPATASADFRRLLDSELVEQSGKGRRIRYRATGKLRGLAAGG